MNRKPVLVVLAAGMGSRYGGLKQMDPMDEQGHAIMDFSIYDAVRAGFEKVIFIIKKENLALFRECIGDRVSAKIQVEYVFQEMLLPDGFTVPEGRVKPFGTGHAVLSCADVVDGPFMVINADDFYGQHAYQMLYDFLTTHTDDDKYHFAMAGYHVENTLAESGYVSRGICTLKEGQEAGYLADVVERTHIEKSGDAAAYTEDEGKTWTPIPRGTLVSMNCWGFSAGLMPELKRLFVEFLKENLEKNPLKCEFYLPFAVNSLLQEGKADVQVLPTTDRWYGVTYREDKESVMAAIAKMKAEGIYPDMA